MYQNSIPQLPKLSQEMYENIFNIYLDKDNRYFYNLLQSIDIPSNLPDGFFTEYTVAPGDTLPFISYKLFRSINLWWLLCLLNNIENPTLTLEPGTTLKVLRNDTIRLIIKEINT